MFSKLRRSVLGVASSSLMLSLLIAPAWSAPKKPEKPTVTPLPEALFIPKARMQLTSDRVNITLINKTNAKITFQAVGDTEPRTLDGQQTLELRGLRAPVTLTLDRQDAGLILLTPTPSAKSPDSLEVSLDATTDMAADATTMRVERNGSVFTY